ncbi:MAG: C40 family peptidase [Agathobacter sp.]|nr:C40 family peptidase [Agathobacter sp.]
MRFDKKTIIGTSGVLVFALLLGCSSFTVSNRNMIEKENYGILSSAGANAAIGNNSTAAGANGAVDGSIGVVDTDGVLVGQGQYDTYGYTNLGMAIVEGNLNVRKEPSSEGSIVGKMTNYAACEILGEENGYYQITSGNVEGYVSADYIVTGEEALKLAQQEVKEMATVTTEALRVREEASTDSRTLAVVNEEDDFVVVEKLDGWIKIEVDDYQGYISSDYAEVGMKLKTGNTMKELTFGNGVSQTRVDLVNYALQFVGNRYVWGGESLTKGVDCSGYTMKIYQKYGIYLPHSSRAQPNHGTKITKDQLRPGDLIFYGNGRSINHVAIYIGNGQVVHASNARDGIKISNAFYRTPVCMVSYLP